VLQTTRGLRFPVEALQQIGIVCQSGSNRLESYQAVDKRVTGAIHDPHATAAQFADEFVFAEFRQFVSYRTENEKRPKFSMLRI
jgi:hypothetical protein